MSRLIIWAIFICAFTEVSVTVGDEPRLPDQPKDYAQLVRPQLPPGWRCTYDFRTLVIARDEEVVFLSGLGLPPGERNDEFFKRHGTQGPYLIVMKFVSRMDEQHQRALVDRRRQAVEDARRGHEHEKYTGGDVYSQFFIPEYHNARCSIDLQTSDYWPLEVVAPVDAVKQRDAILKLLHANLQKYPASP